MHSRTIKTAAEHACAIKRLSVLMDAEPDTPEGDELAILTLQIDTYESANFPPIAAMSSRRLPVLSVQAHSQAEEKASQVGKKTRGLFKRTSSRCRNDPHRN